MQITITGRRFTLDEETRQSTEAKMMAILEYKRIKVTSVTIVMDRESGHRFTVDIAIRYKHHDAEARAEGYDLDKAIDEALVKIDTQLLRFLDRVQDHHAAPLRDVTSAELPAE